MSPDSPSGSLALSVSATTNPLAKSIRCHEFVKFLPASLRRPPPPKNQNAELSVRTGAKRRTSALDRRIFISVAPAPVQMYRSDNPQGRYLLEEGNPHSATTPVRKTESNTVRGPGPSTRGQVRNNKKNYGQGLTRIQATQRDAIFVARIGLRRGDFPLDVAACRSAA